MCIANKSLLCVQLPSTGENCESLTKRMIHMSVREYAHRCKRKKAMWKSEWKEMAFSVFSMMKLWEYRLTVSYEWRTKWLNTWVAPKYSSIKVFKYLCVMAHSTIWVSSSLFYAHIYFLVSSHKNFA